MIYIILCLILCGVVFYKSTIYKRHRRSLWNKHVAITGGSSGIGKAFAILAAKEGAHVTLLARNVDRLEEARNEIKQNTVTQDQIISKVPVDVSCPEAVENNLLEIEETIGPVYMLVNCAGFAVCGKLEDLSERDIKALVDVNLMGTIYAIRAVLPKFKKRREGIIVMTSSAVGLMGMFGYSVYSACKFALRGLAESLVMELKPYNVTVTLALPPDTDTPGFENENKSKPKETKLMSESGGLYKPEVVAKQLLEDALKGNFFSYVGLESFILTTLCVGMTSVNSVLELLLQICLLGPLRLIGTYYIKNFEKIVAKCFSENHVQEK
ncbi:3-ketodihydrosphingosine reductase [Sitophilus oryzae]|uniref:3-dehydrosphinganine reductase n=1 Tax=Sitophilus oryzae TaxID=7048 RepID=A0A6J2X4U1_SITOR|nr:3-ketodihydrosphingosine reductase [Sitophilus oryzae]